MSKVRVITAALVGCACLLAAVAAWGAQIVTVTTAEFSPDKLGAPTNVHGSATIRSTTGGLPSPIVETTLMGPAGLKVDVHGVGICDPAKLEAAGPSGCPKTSKAGFGGGVGEYEIAHELRTEPFTLNFFRGPDENGHLVVLAYVNAISPVSVQLVLKAQVVNEPKPYGLGFTFKVPIIETLPGASPASVEQIFITLGSPNVAYFEQVNGRRTLVHVKGLIVPRKCPSGGFPYKTRIAFADGTANEIKGTIRCPHR
jgi:hypothetical protein